MKYRSKPTECEAFRWQPKDPAHLPQQAEAIVAWVNINGGEARYDSDEAYARSQGAVALPYIEVRNTTAPEWNMARPGDFIYALDGVFRTCDPATFESRWEPTS